MRTSSDGARRRRETRHVVAEVTIHAPPFYNVSVSLFVSGRVKRKRLERSRRVERERKAARFALPTPTSSRGVGTRAARRRSSSCILETPLAFFWPSARVFKQSAKSVNAPPKPKPKTDSNRIKPLFWPNARFPRKRRGTCTRASPAARLGFGRKGTPPALSARAGAVRAKARLADGRARPRVPGIREIRRVADFPTRIVASRAASRHPSARCSTLSTSSLSAVLWGRSGSPRTWTEG
jgi:hypothetical protein